MKPQIGKYYEFSDDEDFVEEYSGVKKLYAIIDLSPPEVYKYIDSDGIGWRYIRPVQGELGK